MTNDDSRKKWVVPMAALLLSILAFLGLLSVGSFKISAAVSTGDQNGSATNTSADGGSVELRPTHRPPPSAIPTWVPRPTHRPPPPPPTHRPPPPVQTRPPHPTHRPPPPPIQTRDPRPTHRPPPTHQPPPTHRPPPTPIGTTVPTM